MPFIPALIVGGQLVVAVADRLPQVNFEQTCRAASSETLGLNDHFDDCVKSEKSARDQLATQWGSYDAAARAHCGRMATGSLSSSYVELLTCLELEKRAKSLHVRGDQTAIIEPEPAPIRQPEEYIAPPQVQPGPVAPPRAQATAAAPTPLAQPRAEAAAAPTPQAQPKSELLGSFCRSPWGLILPACK